MPPSRLPADRMQPTLCRQRRNLAAQRSPRPCLRHQQRAHHRKAKARPQTRGRCPRLFHRLFPSCRPDRTPGASPRPLRSATPQLLRVSRAHAATLEYRSAPELSTKKAQRPDQPRSKRTPSCRQHNRRARHARREPTLVRSPEAARLELAPPPPTPAPHRFPAYAQPGAKLRFRSRTAATVQRRNQKNQPADILTTTEKTQGRRPNAATAPRTAMAVTMPDAGRTPVPDPIQNPLRDAPRLATLRRRVQTTPATRAAFPTNPSRLPRVQPERKIPELEVSKKRRQHPLSSDVVQNTRGSPLRHPCARCLRGKRIIPLPYVTVRAPNPRLPA